MIWGEGFVYLRFGYIFFFNNQKAFILVNSGIRVNNLLSKALTGLKTDKKSSKASEAFQYTEQSINAFTSATPAWQHNYPQLSPYLNGKLNTTEEISGFQEESF